MDHMTTTLAPAGIADLTGAGTGELGDRFRSGMPPATAELDGEYRGVVLAVAPLDRLPGLLRRLLVPVYAAFGLPWRGKRFGAAGDSRGGTNVWLAAHGPGFGAFRCRRESGATVLDYDVALNPLPLRAVQGEVRRVGPGLYLGRMGVRFGGRHVHVLYFALRHD